MDDTQRLALIFDFNDGEIQVSQPTEGQMFTLTALHRDSTDTASQMKVVRRMFRVLEHLVSEEDYEKIEDGMITGDLTPYQVVNLIQEIFSTDWSKAGQDAPVEEPAPAPAPVAVRKAPRPA